MKKVVTQEVRKLVENKGFRRAVHYTEEDNSPDYLLPSNGGYYPKQRTDFMEETQDAVSPETTPHLAETTPRQEGPLPSNVLGN